MDPTPGPPSELVAGKYLLRRLLGRGGMGTVWEGEHQTLGTRVAVKFIENEYVESTEAQHRFENEARAAAKLRSKHAVKVHDHGVMSDGRPYIVMEYLSGEPLDARLARVGRLPLAETAVIVLHICRALTQAHQEGIVHRDLKPENVFLVRDEDDGTEIAKVVDFGIAKFVDSSAGLSSSTKTGSVLGTPYFMSPEQARGLRSIDYRSDLWSVGVIAYRCLVGELPFVGEAVGDLLVQICVAPLPVPSQKVPGLPPTFDQWLHKALAREPAERFQSAAELAEAMLAVAGISARAPVASAWQHEPPLQSAPTLAADSSGALVRLADGVTAAPFTQNTGPVKRAAPLGWIIGGALATFFAIGLAAAFFIYRSRTPVASDVEALPVSAAAAVPGPTPAPAPSASTEPLEVTPTAEPPPSASAEPEEKPRPASTAVAKPTRTVTRTKPTQGKNTPATGKTGTPDIGY